MKEGESSKSVREVVSSSETAHDSNGGSSSKSEDATSSMWFPKLMICLTKKEKEQDFLIFKGSSKLPKKPKRRAKTTQRAIDMITPGTWLNNLSLERYEVREKKISKMRPRGLKAMCNIHSDSESNSNSEEK